MTKESILKAVVDELIYNGMIAEEDVPEFLEAVDIRIAEYSI